MLSVKEKLQFLDRSSAITKPSTESNTELFGAADLAKINAISVGDAKNFYILREKSFSLDFSHGGHALGDFLAIAPRTLSLISKDETVGELFPADFIFFDTETTGLAGGSGTFVFLLGIGFFHANYFTIKQFLLPDYKSEEFFLKSLCREFEPFHGLISYNGKSYDMPLLKTRFVMNRMPFHDFDRKTHIDLLYAARRLWKKSVGACSLQSIEKNVLGFARQNDVPGCDIPTLYFNFLENKELAPLVPVLKHNVIDILTLAAIAVRASGAFHGEQTVYSSSPYDLRAVFHAYAALGDVEQALLLAEASPQQNDIKLKIDHAFLLKRLGKSEKAHHIWKNMLSNKSFIEIAYLELAKYYEHSLKSYTKALSVINAAMNRIDISKALHPDRESVAIENWEYRRQRILRKIETGKHKNDN